MRKITRFSISAMAITGIVAGGYAGGAAMASTPALLAPFGVHAEGSTPAPVPSYAKNDTGLTYGSAMQAISTDTEPDLILVVATNGKEGYVLKADLDEANGSNVANPEEALAWQRAHEGTTQVLSVYASDGRTPVGDFQVNVETLTSLTD